MTLSGGAPFDLSRTSSIVVDGTNPEVSAIAEKLAAQLRRPTEFPLAISSGASAPAAIVLRLVSDAALGEEGYTLSVSADSIRLVANRPAGLFHGIQTIRQLLPADIESDMGSERSTWQVPALTITDSPRFAWRGAMLDVARHFFTVDEVEQFI
ncbi:MAG TPA: beta-N-acetylhexosaminidase, partial [Gemmatimonadaceae bacterium]